MIASAAAEQSRREGRIRAAAEHAAEQRRREAGEDTTTLPTTPSPGRLIAHEARPGHELQFDSMVEHGVSLARALYAFNSTNVEGWGLYAEYITKPYMPLEGQLISLQMRLQRAARAFLDPELAVRQDQARNCDACADRGRQLERAVRQVGSGTLHIPLARDRPTRISTAIRAYCSCERTPRRRLGQKFDQKKFHDFILAQGLLPPTLMRHAVFEDFVPAQKAN